MLFHSSQYLLYFLPIVFFLYYFKYKKFQFPNILTLSIASVVFYSAWNIFFTFDNFYNNFKLLFKQNSD